MNERLKREARDLVELVLLPGLAALLPWPIAFRLLRRAAGWNWLYRTNADRALEEARSRGWVGDIAHWRRVRRLVTLVDHADYYLSRFRGDAWIGKYLDVQGMWPAPNQAGVLCTFHWGAGMWGLRHARAHGLRPHALVAALEGSHFARRTVLHWYAKARTAEVARVLGAATLDTTASLRPAVRTLRSGGQVLAAIDVPADQVLASEEIRLLGMRTQVPRGLLRLAVEHQLPVTVYLTGLRSDTGRRTLEIIQLGKRDNLDDLVREVFDHLESAIRADPPAWHFWSEAPRFFHR